jgi:hypothetical protein
MVAWMRACASVVPAPPASPVAPAGIPVPLCPSVQREVVDVLAAIALTTGLEVTT